MNERNVAYDQDLYATSHVNKESEKNQFTWFKDPNFKIDNGESSDDEEMNTAQLMKNRDVLKPQNRLPALPRKSHGKVDSKKLEMFKDVTSKMTKEFSPRDGKTTLKNLEQSDLFLRRSKLQ